jgi:hypothetical protein
MSDRIPLISVQTANMIKGLKRRGSATTQLVQDPVAVITIMRTATQTIATFTPIAIALDARVPQGGGGDVPVTMTVQSGTIEVFDEDLAAPIHQGDRFAWQGQPCTVSTISGAAYGVVTIAFTLDSRNRGV